MKYWVWIVIVLLVLFSFKAFLSQEITGKSVSSGIITLTKVGSAGIQMTDENIAFGSGYVQGCEYAVVNSNLSSSCWVNVSEFVEDYHLLVNNGSSLLNVTASVVGLNDAEEFFCGDCLYTDNARILVYSVNAESGSCRGLTNSAESVATYNSVNSVGVCDYFDFADASDSVKVYIEFYVPKDTSVGSKSFLISYEASVY
jgi:hypothetical protein